MKPVRLARGAQRDIDDATAWYDGEATGLGVRFLTSVRRVLGEIAERPQRFPIAHAKMRRALVGRFPYGVFFIEMDDVVRVVAVVHLARDPRTWQARA